MGEALPPPAVAVGAKAVEDAATVEDLEARSVAELQGEGSSESVEIMLGVGWEVREAVVELLRVTRWEAEGKRVMLRVGDTEEVLVPV